MSAIATYLTQSGKRRIFRCHTCATHISETRETVFFDLRTSEEKVMMALKMLLVRVDLAGVLPEILKLLKFLTFSPLSRILD